MIFTGAFTRKNKKEEERKKKDFIALQTRRQTANTNVVMTHYERKIFFCST
jgi:hypothetical protein